MKCLVTGGAGYIGSHAVKMLIEQGNDVVVIDNLSTGHIKSIDERAIFYDINLHETDKIEEVLTTNNIDIVFHFAAYSLVDESVKNPLKYYRNNIGGTISLIHAMTNVGINQIIFSSTAAVYGESTIIPINEDSPLNPSNPYGETKKTIEKVLEALSQSNDSFNYISLRYFNVAGAYHTGDIGENHNPETHLIPNVIKSVFSGHPNLKVFGNDYDTPDGSAIRDYIHVEDLIDAHIKAAQHLEKHKKSDTFNLGTSSGYSILEIIKMCETVMGTEIPYTIVPRRAGDPAILIASFDKAKEKLKWTPQYDLKQIITSAFNYYKKGV